MIANHTRLDNSQDRSFRLERLNYLERQVKSMRLA